MSEAVVSHVPYAESAYQKAEPLESGKPPSVNPSSIDVPIPASPVQDLEQTALFANSEATHAAQEYASILTNLKRTTPLKNGRIILAKDPTSLNNYVNILTQQMDALGLAKQQVEANLTTTEQRRWLQIQKNLDISND